MVGTTRTYIGKISVNATGTEVTFSAAYPTETTIDATYLKYSFNTADTATFNLTFVIKDDSGADNATAECSVGVRKRMIVSSFFARVIPT